MTLETNSINPVIHSWIAAKLVVDYKQRAYCYAPGSVESPIQGRTTYLDEEFICRCYQ